jgi:hypothetical protein
MTYVVWHIQYELVLPSQCLVPLSGTCAAWLFFRSVKC